MVPLSFISTDSPGSSDITFSGERTHMNNSNAVAFVHFYCLPVQVPVHCRRVNHEYMYATLKTLNTSMRFIQKDIYMWTIKGVSQSIPVLVYSTPPLIATHLFSQTIVLIREVSFREREHYMHSQYFKRICVLSTWGVLSRECPLGEAPLYFAVHVA